MFFAPDYAWEKANDELVDLFRDSFAGEQSNDFSGPYQDERCLNGNCLSQQGGELIYNGRPLSWPEELKNSQVAAVSLGLLSRQWLVGFTLKDGNNYRGQVFYFDGSKFKLLVLPAEIYSTSFGLFGFGGDDSDFILVYGADQARAFRVRNSVATDISRWFSPRVMEGGFKPEILRVKKGTDVIWYVYSSTLSRPQFIKLWQNGTQDIVGEAVFSDLLAFSYPIASFRLVSSQDYRVVLLVRMQSGNAEEWKIFIDRGFKNAAPAELVTKPISRNGGVAMVISSIVSVDLDLDAASAKTVDFSFSEDGQSWRQVPVGKNQPFLTDKIRSYFLKVRFPALTDRFQSPFLDSILFNYSGRRFKD
jgi:hypothetical protein